MATSIGGVTVRDPSEIVEIEFEMIGKSERSLDGSLLTDYAAVKRSWRVDWDLLTAAEFAVIEARFWNKITGVLVGEQYFNPPDGSGSFLVWIEPDQYQPTMKPAAGGPRYQVTMVLKEV